MGLKKVKHHLQRMTDIKYSDPCGWRYCDHPRPGSIYTLPDIPELVRGPTVVLLPSKRDSSPTTRAEGRHKPCRSARRCCRERQTARLAQDAQCKTRSKCAERLQNGKRASFPACSRSSETKCATCTAHGNESSILRATVLKCTDFGTTLGS